MGNINTTFSGKHTVYRHAYGADYKLSVRSLLLHWEIILHRLLFLK